MCGSGGGTDPVSSLLPLGFATVWGDTVGLMFAWVPGHGTCPQGGHTKSAVPDIANVSVLFLLVVVVASDLQ